MVMHDGSINFYDLDANIDPHTLRCLIASLPGVCLTGEILCDPLDECWFDFKFKGEEFTVNNPYASAYGFWFFCSNPNCSRAILAELVEGVLAKVKAYL